MYLATGRSSSIVHNRSLFACLIGLAFFEPRDYRGVFVEQKSPDDENHWDFCFYQCEKSYIVDTHVFKSKPKEYRVKIKLKV